MRSRAAGDLIRFSRQMDAGGKPAPESKHTNPAFGLGRKRGFSSCGASGYPEALADLLCFSLSCRRR